MLQLNDIHLKRGERQLFEKLALTVHAGWRLGLVGRNGAGKTTLFQLVLGRLLPEEGDVLRPAAWRIAYMAQDTVESDGTALDWVQDGDADLRAAQRAVARAEASGDANAIAAAFARLDAVDGYTAEARAGEILYGLGFAPGDAQRPVNAFSGGWRIRLNLARTLMAPSELLLLDEPTNHLDLDATLWLERWLLRYPGTLVLISHDREFLDRVTTHIAHLQHRRAQVYRGNYTSFERQRLENLEREQAVFDRQQARIKEIRGFVDRFKAKASKARQAQSRMRQLEKLSASAPLRAEAPYAFELPAAGKMSNPLLSIHAGVIGYPGVDVARGIEVRLYPGSRIGLLGRNGAGKSTLIRSIAGELPLRGGERLAGDHCAIGYFTQHTTESLDPDQTAVEHLLTLDRRVGEGRARTWFGGWGFTGEMALNPARNLSGGERARLALALLAWQRPALLLLDEPTNHLDLDMREALVVALQDYDGAVVMVSHDRHLLGSCVDDLLLVDAGKVEPFRGDLDDYAAWLLGRQPPATDARKAAPTPAATATGNADPAAPGRDRRDDRKRSADLRARTLPLRNALRDAERHIERLTRKLGELEAKLADPALYDAASRDDAIALAIEQGRLRSELEAAETRWLEIGSELEAAEAS